MVLALAIGMEVVVDMAMADPPHPRPTNLEVAGSHFEVFGCGTGQKKIGLNDLDQMAIATSMGWQNLFKNDPRTIPKCPQHDPEMILK